jgi:hypothetical protein
MTGALLERETLDGISFKSLLKPVPAIASDDYEVILNQE